MTNPPELLPAVYNQPCGAKTRAGTPCEKAALPNGKCHLHGGLSPAGKGSPRYIHGKYSHHLPAKMREKFEEAMENPDPLNLGSEMALLEAHVSDLSQRIEDGESRENWKVLRDLMKRAKLYRAKGQEADFLSAFEQMQEIVRVEDEIAANRQELRETIESMRKLAEYQKKRLLDMHRLYTAEQFLLYFGAIVDSVDRHLRRHIDDAKVISAILTGIQYDAERLNSLAPREEKSQPF